MSDFSSAASAGAASRDRREFETHWQMNPVTREIFDRAVAAAIAARGGEPIDLVLDIGCGRQSNVVFPGARRVVGTDVDGEGLRGNQTVDEAIETDIVEARLPEDCVDAIACIYVLEHVPQPDVVFGKLARALRPGGVMVIAVPNVGAPKAKVTRATPLWFHTYVYVRLLGKKDPNTGLPFETVLDPSIRPDRLEHLAAVCGLEVIEWIDFEDNKQRQLRTKFHLTGWPWRLLRRALLLGSRNRIDPEMSDVVMVFQRAERPLGRLAEAISR